MDTINLLNEPMVMMKQREITKNSKYNKNKAIIHTFGMGFQKLSLNLFQLKYQGVKDLLPLKREIAENSMEWPKRCGTAKNSKYC